MIPVDVSHLYAKLCCKACRCGKLHMQLEAMWFLLFLHDAALLTLNITSGFHALMMCQNIHIVTTKCFFAISGRTQEHYLGKKLHVHNSICDFFPQRYYFAVSIRSLLWTIKLTSFSLPQLRSHRFHHMQWQVHTFGSWVMPKGKKKTTTWNKSFTLIQPKKRKSRASFTSFAVHNCPSLKSL